ncbi:DUF4357 domain-containing protein [Corynebacterium otitidis]|uniref:DUF4357 domain-containing protein n=1 Tax=Corynebacterium otitidis TaxID=29321 RepID=UPI001F51B98D|nr:DUF4357 domain-containing protein [Corynebacterium otitidis]
MSEDETRPRGEPHAGRADCDAVPHGRHAHRAHQVHAEQLDRAGLRAAPHGPGREHASRGAHPERGLPLDRRGPGDRRAHRLRWAGGQARQRQGSARPDHRAQGRPREGLLHQGDRRGRRGRFPRPDRDHLPGKRPPRAAEGGGAGARRQRRRARAGHRHRGKTRGARPVLGVHAAGDRFARLSAHRARRSRGRPAASTSEDDGGRPGAGEPELHLEAAGAAGRGRRTPEGFVVYRGAQLRGEVRPSAPASVARSRELLAERIDAGGVLTRDTLFGSPSAASSFLTGSSTNGLTLWRDGSGVSLKDLEG